jgi:hypothetical protein
MSAHTKHTNRKPASRALIRSSALLGILLLFPLYGIQNGLAVVTVLSDPLGHFDSTKAGRGNNLHKPNAINNTHLKWGNRNNLFCIVGNLLRGPDTVFVPGESHLQAKFSKMSSVLLAAIEPLTEQNEAPSDEGTDKAVNGWVEFYHGMSGVIEVVIGYVLVTLVYLRWPCFQSRYGKTTILQALEILSSPILCPLFWRRLWREVIIGNPSCCFPLLSRTTRLVFLLDPGAATVWPHPRHEPAPCVGTVLAHWILRLRNPHQEVQKLPGLGCQTSAEIESEFLQELRWRMMMLVSYGDKWPNK